MWKRAGDIGVRLRSLREGLGLTQEAFAEMMGVVDQSVSDYENGRSQPSRSRLERLARQLQIPVSVFSEGGPSPTVALERARMPQEGQTTRGPGRRQEDIDLRAGALRKDGARLEVIGRLLQSYRDAGQPIPVDMIIELLAILQANSPANGPLEQ